MLEQQFNLKGHGTSVRGELLAGLTTVLAMPTVACVNPASLAAAGMDVGAVFAAILSLLKFASI